LLLAGTFLNTLGYQIFVPLLPLYLASLGASPTLIGVIIGVGLLWFALGQYVAGVLADRIDRRVFAAAASTAYGLIFFAYLVPLSLEVVIPIRLTQAFVGSLFAPAALALAGELAPPGGVSRAYGKWQATSMVGFLVGPVLGGVLVANSFAAAFLVAAAFSVVASIPLLAIQPGARHSAVARESHRLTHISPRTQLRAILPLIGAGAAPEYFSGAFLSGWAIFLTAAGGAPWEVGVSYTLFALPAMLLSVWFGGLTDRRGPRVVVGIALALTAVLAPFYAVVASVPLLMALILGQGVTVAASRPALYSEAAHLLPPDYRGRSQGILLTGTAITQSFGALASGLLYGISPALVFSSVLVVVGISLLVLPFVTSSPRHTSVMSATEDPSDDLIPGEAPIEGAR
jgi:MFS family permease